MLTELIFKCSMKKIFTRDEFMELKSYFYKRNLKKSNSGYGVVATSVEACPVGIVKKIGFACTNRDCCKGSAPHMKIVENENSWIKCEETTKAMEIDPDLGKKETSVAAWL